MDANDAWGIIQSGGVAGSLFLGCLYLGVQVHRLNKRNDILYDREASRADTFATTVAELRHAIDRLAERINAPR